MVSRGLEEEVDERGVVGVVTLLSECCVGLVVGVVVLARGVGVWMVESAGPCGSQ